MISSRPQTVRAASAASASPGSLVERERAVATWRLRLDEYRPGPHLDSACAAARVALLDQVHARSPGSRAGLCHEDDVTAPMASLLDAP